MGKWFSKETSPEVKTTEIISIQGSNNQISTEHLTHLENISIAITVVAIILVIGSLFILFKCLAKWNKKRQIKMLQHAMARGL